MTEFEHKKNNLLNFGGVISAVATPYNENGKVNLSEIKEYAKSLYENGVHGVFILGTTGEVFSLTLQEKINLLKAWMEAIETIHKINQHRLLTIVNVSSTVFSEIDALAKIAQDLNVDAIGILPPIYIPITKVDDLVSYVLMVGKCAVELPILYYHIPMFTRELPFELSNFIESCLQKSKQLTALKFTDGNILRLNEILASFSNKINIMNGYEESILPAVSIGCRAAICATANLPDVAGFMNTIFDRSTSIAVKQKAHHSLVNIVNKVKQTGNGHFFYGLKKLLNQSNLPLKFGIPRAPIYIIKQE